MRRRTGFTLVEVMIATAVGAIFSIAVMSLLSRFTRMATLTGEQATVAREVNMVMATFRNAIRASTSEPLTGEINHFKADSSVDGVPYMLVLHGEEGAAGSMEIQTPNEDGEAVTRHIGSKLFLKMEVKKLGISPSLYQLKLWYANPRSMQPPTLENALVAVTVAAQRAIAPAEGNSFWVPNDKSLP